MAAVANPGPVPAAAQPVAVRIAASVADTTSADVAAIQGLPRCWEVPELSLADTSLPMLSWTKTANQCLRVPVSEVQGICLLVTQWDLSQAPVRNALQAANVIEHRLTRAACSSIFHELKCAGILGQIHASESEFQEAVKSSPLLQVASLSGLANWIELEEPFDTAARPGAPARGRHAAIPAVAAVNGPAELAFLQRVTWLQLISEGERTCQGVGQSYFPDS